MRLNKWSELDLSLGRINIPVKVGKSIGYMEVFETIEDYHKDYPKEINYIQIETIKNEDKTKQS